MTYPADKASMHQHDEPPSYTETASTAVLTPSSSRASTLTTASAPITTSSIVQNPLRGQDTKFAMLSLSNSDRLRFIRFPEAITALASEIVQGLWPKGIQRVQNYDESVELKLRGNPLGYGYDEEKVAIRVTLMGLLNAFAKEGWRVIPAGGRVGRMGDYGAFGQKGIYFISPIPW